MITAISLSEFKRSAPEIYRRLLESDGPIYVETDGRAVIEIRRFLHGPTISQIRGNTTLSDDDIVFPIEPDGYAPFK